MATAASTVPRPKLDFGPRHPCKLHRHSCACRRSKTREMRWMPPKDAALLAQKWREISCKQNRDSVPAIRSAKTACGKNVAHCPQALARITPHPPSATSQHAHSSSPDFGFSASRDGPGIALSYAEPCARVRPPAALRRVLFRIPNGFTELVPTGILLLQTANVSIH